MSGLLNFSDSIDAARQPAAVAPLAFHLWICQKFKVPQESLFLPACWVDQRNFLFFCYLPKIFLLCALGRLMGGGVNSLHFNGKSSTFTNPWVPS